MDIKEFFADHKLYYSDKNRRVLESALEGKDPDHYNLFEALKVVYSVLEPEPSTSIPEPAIFAAADRVFRPEEIVQALNKVLDDFPTVERSKYNMQRVVEWVFQNNVLPIYKNLRAGVRILEPALTHVLISAPPATETLAPPLPPQETPRRLSDGTLSLPKNALEAELRKASKAQLKDFLRDVKVGEQA
jgi:hypothetical protein